jgi:hypothetical protein
MLAMLDLLHMGIHMASSSIIMERRREGGRGICAVVTGNDVV